MNAKCKKQKRAICVSFVAWGPGDEAPGRGCVFQCRNSIFNANFIGLGRFSTWGAQTTASEASRPSACARRSRGSRGLAPGGGCKGTLKQSYATVVLSLSLSLSCLFFLGGGSVGRFVPILLYFLFLSIILVCLCNC